MTRRFADFVAKSSPCDPPLPLVHTCDAFNFRGIVADSRLSTAPCRVFEGEPLVYFFYGRPAYRSMQISTATSHPAFMPVALVLSPNAILALKRIAPFDTGAFALGLFANYMHTEMRKEDFLLPASMDMPSRVVKLFYGSNRDYYSGKPLTIEIPPIEFEVRSYYELIKERGNASFDDRCSTIEIQSGQALELTGDNVVLIVLPGVFLDDEEIRETICGKWNAEIRSYAIHRGNPVEYIGLVYRAVEEFFRDNGYM